MKKNKIIYEKQLSKSLGFTLREGSLFFSGKNSTRLQKTLNNLTKMLDKLGIRYLLAGGFAVMLYGFRRFTEDIDIVVTRNDLVKIHRELIGHGYIEIFEGSRGIRDTETGVRIEFVVAGEYPGDGKPKPVIFPEPDLVKEEIKGIKVVNLPTLIELKLASGMTGGFARAHDLKDVYELIRIHKLDEAFATKLNSTVRNKYVEILNEIRKKNG